MTLDLKEPHRGDFTTRGLATATEMTRNHMRVFALTTAEIKMNESKVCVMLKDLRLMFDVGSLRTSLIPRAVRIPHNVGRLCLFVCINTHQSVRFRNTRPFHHTSTALQHGKFSTTCRTLSFEHFDRNLHTF